MNTPIATGAFAVAGRLPGMRDAAPRLVLVGGLLLVVDLLAVAIRVVDLFHSVVILLILACAVYAFAVRLVVMRDARVPLWFIIALALAMRIGPLLLAPYFSTDIFRYVWDGKVQGAGINPYLYVPNDPALSALRDATIWPLINRASYAPTIYPPVAEMIFFLATQLSASVLALKAVFVLFEGVTMWGLIRLLDAEGLPRSRVLIYAWCPLCVWEFAGSGHVDAAMTAFVTLALLAARHDRPAAAGIALGLAVLTKFFPILLLPALWRRWDWKLPLATALVIVIGYLIYLGAGWHVLGFLPGYAGEEGLSSGKGFWLLGLARDTTGAALPSFGYIAAVALLMAGFALWVTTQNDRRVKLYAGSLLLAAAGMLALTPSYPWYLAWLLPMLCLAPVWPLFWLIGSCFLLYWADTRDIAWMEDVVYGGTFLLLIGDSARRLAHRPFVRRLA